MYLVVSDPCLQERDGRLCRMNKQPDRTPAGKALRSPQALKVLFGGRAVQRLVVSVAFGVQGKGLRRKTCACGRCKRHRRFRARLLSAEIRDKPWSDYVITDNAIRLRGEECFLSHRGIGAQCYWGAKSAP